MLIFSALSQITNLPIVSVAAGIGLAAFGFYGLNGP
jgi:hypothetical protein